MDLVVALLNFFSGLCLSVPALRLTRDLGLIGKVENSKDGENALTRRMRLMNTNALRMKLDKWDFYDTVFLYLGLGLFGLASFIDILIKI